jgi:hypothetical protein
MFFAVMAIAASQIAPASPDKNIGVTAALDGGSFSITRNREEILLNTRLSNPPSVFCCNEQ